MRLALATILSVAAISPALAAVTGDARLDAFVDACLEGYRDPVVRAGVIERAGWVEVADDADPELAALMTESRKAMVQAKEEDDITGVVHVYGGVDEEAPLYLVATETYMSRTEDGNEDWIIDLLACHLYDFAAVEPLDPALVTAHFNEKPVEVVNQPGIKSQAWNVDSMIGVWSVHNTFIPEGSEASAQTGFAGVMLKITSTLE